MRAYFFILFTFIFFTFQSLSAEKKQSGKIPYFLKDYAAEYQELPRKASLAWFEQARMGMFIHWGVWGKYHEAWAMYNNLIPLDEYQKTAREVMPQDSMPSK